MMGMFSLSFVFEASRRLAQLAIVCCLSVVQLAYAGDKIKTETPLPDGVFPRTVVDVTGAVRIDKLPKRIVVLSTGQTDALLTLGIVPVGATRDGSGVHFPGYLRDAFPALAPRFIHTQDLGLRSAPDLEVLAALRPDLILANKSVIRSGILAQFRLIAPTIITNGAGINWRKDFLMLSDALGKRQAAQQWMQDFKQDAKRFAVDLNAQVQTPQTPQRQQAVATPQVSFSLAGGGRLRVMGVSSFVGDIAQEMGLQRPPSQQFKRTSQDISMERLDLVDGDWLFYGALGAATDTYTTSPLWPYLHVVGAGHAVAVDYDAFYMNAGPTAARYVMRTLRQHLMAPSTQPAAIHGTARPSAASGQVAARPLAHAKGAP